jgi:hypothetical protein
VTILLVIHLLGMATLIAALFVRRRTADGLSNLWLWGGVVQAVTGLAMVGVIDGARINGGLGGGGHIKIGVKRLVLIVIGLLAMIGKNRPGRASQLSTVMGVLTVVNVAIAVLWTS